MLRPGTAQWFRKVGRGRACPAGEGGAGSLGKARPQPGGGNHGKVSPPGTSRGSPSDAGEPTPHFHPRTLFIYILREGVGCGVWLRPWDWGVARNGGARWLLCGSLCLGTSTQVAAVALAESVLNRCPCGTAGTIRSSSAPGVAAAAAAAVATTATSTTSAPRPHALRLRLPRRLVVGRGGQHLHRAC
jgi:hypothetical protein